ncbi:hypothetical protein GCM10008018_38570 [Paenibacillus marchantiophytorum]|uniref:Uncharacterized protein n=1 Tax=Paenibacillus marchantiophytorum TaxID=1619310 RepID=A0ABQ1EV17_9BACL|nr:hypothetical protein [Paenibacillus marchantiophytorum]GFZ88778.1 hypothetical protein GCM10008018_38570 [Paenibacillus marchantiophytorum]
MYAVAYADQIQSTLSRLYWNTETQLMNQWDDSLTNPRVDENYYYWWQAHAVDVCLDGLGMAVSL